MEKAKKLLESRIMKSMQAFRETRKQSFAEIGLDKY
jgi:hypothetical protein